MKEETLHSRRDFVRAALACGTGIAALGVVGCTSGGAMTNAEPTSWDVETDVVVCGSGTGGAPAAIEAHDAGAKVLIIEKMDWLGGSMRRCAGGMFGADTIVQHHLGIDDDSPDMAYEYMVACGEGRADEGLLRVFADNAGKNIDWVIQDLGGQPLEEWDFSTPEDNGETICIRPGLNVSGTPVYFEKFDMPDYRYPRTHWFKENPEDQDPGDRHYADCTAFDGPPTGGGTGLWKTFENALTERSIEIKTETTLKKLVMSDDNEVIGVIAESGGKDLRIKANKGVVIATGGFRNNEQMMLDYRQALYVPFTEEQMTHGEPLATEHDGRGVQAALAVGAGASTIGSANGGLKINADAQVLDAFNEPIGRLYASSKAVGGIMVELEPSCGINVSAWVCFGRIAGQNVGKLDPIGQ